MTLIPLLRKWYFLIWIFWKFDKINSQQKKKKSTFTKKITLKQKIINIVFFEFIIISSILANSVTSFFDLFDNIMTDALHFRAFKRFDFFFFRKTTRFWIFWISFLLLTRWLFYFHFFEIIKNNSWSFKS